VSFEGLWISPEGERIPVVEHLLALQHDPHLFGLTLRDVKGADVEALRILAGDLTGSFRVGENLIF